MLEVCISVQNLYSALTEERPTDSIGILGPRHCARSWKTGDQGRQLPHPGSEPGLGGWWGHPEPLDPERTGWPGWGRGSHWQALLLLSLAEGPICQAAEDLRTPSASEGLDSDPEDLGGF